MTWGRDRLDAQRATREDLSIGEQPIELAAVHGDVRQIERVTEGLLHLADALADRGLCAEVVLQPLRAGQVIRVRVSLEDVVHAQLALAHERCDSLERPRRGSRCEDVVVEDRIDHDRVAAGRVVHDIGERGRVGIEEGSKIGRAHV